MGPPGTGFHPEVSDDSPGVNLKSSYIDHRAVIGKVRIETTWTYKRKSDGQKKSKYRKERWRVRDAGGRTLHRAHYIGRVENGEFIPTCGTRTAGVPVASRMAV